MKYRPYTKDFDCHSFSPGALVSSFSNSYDDDKAVLCIILKKVHNPPWCYDVYTIETGIFEVVHNYYFRAAVLERFKK